MERVLKINKVKEEIFVAIREFGRRLSLVNGWIFI